MASSKSQIKSLDAIKQDAANARLPFDKDQLLNLAFFLDNQYVQWNADANALQVIDRDARMKRAPRPVANKIMHFVLKQRASVLEAQPVADVLPATDDPQDVSITGPALAYLRWLDQPQVADVPSETAEAALWALAGGEGFLKWTWDAAAGRGDVMACSGLEVFPDPYARKFKHVRYIFHEQFMDVHQVKQIYGVDVQPTQMSKADITRSALLRDMGMAPVLNGALVTEVWVKPGVDARWPKGLFCVYSGQDFLIEPQPFPYAHGHLPFTILGAIPRVGSPHYTCTVKYLRSPQMELNKLHAQGISVREAFANPKWWVPTELELESDPDDSPHQILRGNSSGGQYEPSIIQPSTFPDDLGGNWIVEEMMDVAGQHETSQGRVPGRVEAARAIEQLKQADDSHLQEMQRTMTVALSEGYWQLLMLAKQYGSKEIMVQAYSREGLPEVKRLLSEKLHPGMRVRVTMGSGLANTRAARQDQAMLMWQNGIITDPEVMADLMDVPVGTLTPQKVYDVRKARNENLAMAEQEGIDGTPGVAITPNSWDDHDIHLREHNAFRKTTEYDQLEDEAKKKFEYHCDTHENMKLEVLQKKVQEAQLMAAAGAPPDAGGTSSPNAPVPSDAVPPDDESEAPVAPEPVMAGAA